MRRAHRWCEWLWRVSGTRQSVARLQHCSEHILGHLLPVGIVMEEDLAAKTTTKDPKKETAAKNPNESRDPLRTWFHRTSISCCGASKSLEYSWSNCKHSGSQICCSAKLSCQTSGSLPSSVMVSSSLSSKGGHKPGNTCKKNMEIYIHPMRSTS